MKSPKARRPWMKSSQVTWFIEEQYAYDNMIQARDFYLLNLGK